MADMKKVYDDLIIINLYNFDYIIIQLQNLKKPAYLLHPNSEK